MKNAAVEVSVPEIRFKPSADVYLRAAQFAERLGLSVTDVARMGLAQLAHSQQFSLAPEPPQALRDMPVHGTTLGRVAAIASAAARNATQAHVQAGRLPAATDPGRTTER